jgi:putative oxidoreductase
MIPLFFVWSTLALFLLRVFFGLVFLIHGWPKIKDLKQTAANFNGMGFKPGIFWGTIVAVVEFFGGLLLIVGLFTQIVALLLAIQMLVATVWKIRRKQPFAGGYEFDLALLLIGLILATSGGGNFSLDSWLSWYFFGGF